MKSTESETMIRIEQAIRERKREERRRCWDYLQSMCEVVLTDTHRSEWLNMTELARLAKKHNILWGTIHLDRHQLQMELRGFFDTYRSVSIGNVEVEPRDGAGRRSKLRVQFRRTFNIEPVAGIQT